MQLEYDLHSLFLETMQQDSPVQLAYQMIYNFLDFAFSGVKPAFLVIFHLQDPSLQCFPAAP